MALYMVLEDFSGDVGTTSKGVPVSLVQAGTLLDDTQFNIPRLLADGCPVVLYDAATMADARDAFEKMSGGLAQINPDGNLLALLFATGVISGAVGPSNCAFVDVAGSAAGIVGNAAKPFATVKQAIDALAAAGLTWGQVRIGPGSFIADVGAIPNALVNLSIIGSGQQATQVVTLTAASTLFDLGVGVARDNFLASGFTASAPGGLAVRYNGAAAWTAGNAFAAGSLILDCLIASGGLDIKRLGSLNFRGPSFQCYGDVALEQVTQPIALANCIFGGNLTFTQDWDDAAIGANTLGNFAMFNGLVFNDIIVNKQAVIEASYSNCDGTLHGTLSAALAGNDPGGFIWTGGIIRAIDFRTGANILPDTVKACKMNFRLCYIRESADFKVAGASANFQDVGLRDCTLFETSNVPIFGHNIHADARGVSAWGPSYFATPDASGDVVCDAFQIGPVDASALPNPVPIAIPFRLRSNNYAVTLDADDATMLPLGATARTVLQVDITVAVNAGHLRAVITPVNS